MRMNGRLPDSGNLNTFEDYGLTELLDEEYSPRDDIAEWRDALRSALHENYAQAPSDEVEDTLFNILETLEPAEAFNFTKALSQIGRGASKALQNPVAAQIANAGLPVVGGALGGVLGGPVGAAVGSSLGKSAAASLPGRKG